MKKKVFIIIGIIIGIIVLDSLQAMLFDNSPLIKIREYYNGGTLHYKDKGIFVDSYCGFNGVKDTVIKGFSYSLSYDGNFKIIDKTKENKDLACDEQEELFYEDEQYKYYFPCIKSNYVKVVYSNGSDENVIPALNNKHINIGDLDKFEIEYIKYEK